MQSLLFFLVFTVFSAHAATNQKLTSALCKAVVESNLEGVLYWLSHGASANCHCTPDRHTPVMFASFIGNKDIVTALIDYGANVHTIDSHGNSVLHAAVLGGDADKTEGGASDRVAIVKTLLSKKVPVDRALDKPYSAISTLSSAMYLCRPDLAEPLLQAGANLYQKDAEGRTPLDVADNRCNEAFFEVLKDYLPNRK